MSRFDLTGRAMQPVEAGGIRESAAEKRRNVSPSGIAVVGAGAEGNGRPLGARTSTRLSVVLACGTTLSYGAVLAEPSASSNCRRPGP